MFMCESERGLENQTSSLQQGIVGAKFSVWRPVRHYDLHANTFMKKPNAC